MASTIQVMVLVGLGTLSSGCRRRHLDIPALSPAPTALITPGASGTQGGGVAAIDYERGHHGGITGGGQESRLRVWENGSVVFDDEYCEDLVGARYGSLPAARVAELLDALERGGVFDLECEPVAPKRSYPDQSVSYEVLTVRRGDKSMRISGDCGSALQDARAAITFVVGPSPCGGWEAKIARIEETLAQLERDLASEVSAIAEGRTERAAGEARMTAIESRKQGLERRLAQVRRFSRPITKECIENPLGKGCL